MADWQGGDATSQVGDPDLDLDLSAASPGTAVAASPDASPAAPEVADAVGTEARSWGCTWPTRKELVVEVKVVVEMVNIALVFLLTGCIIKYKV